MEKSNDWLERMRLTLDYSNVMDSCIGRERGISSDAIESMGGTIKAIDKKLKMDRAEGRLPFMDILYHEEVVQDSISLANEYAFKHENFLVIGIGGSTWGSIALHSALSHPYYNLLPKEKRGGRPRFFLIDNCDPAETAGLIDLLDAEKTLINIVSKSGATPEPMANFVKYYGIMSDSVGADCAEHFIITTDEGDGVLRKVAKAEGIRCLDIPKGVGGRFSVFSPAGLFPAAVLGIDIEDSLAGARYMDERCKQSDVWQNPAYLFAVLEYLLITEKNYNISVLMPYSRKLRHIVNWYVQLWAESLGKEKTRNGETINAGSTPLKAIGAADQHSLLQLFNEGPFDKSITFIKIEHYENEVAIPRLFSGYNELEYFGGHSLEELIKTELVATQLALTRYGRPNKTIILPEINAFTVGELLYFYEIVTTVMGELYNVNAFDQPGVEEGKNITYALMGRKGFERRKKELLNSDYSY
jgi:glucose-6-phosphate isomerase